jgi:flagellar hook assembly protein FlgD
MSTIGNVTLLSPGSSTSSTSSTTSSNSSQTLTQQDFLKIMVAQFTQQDPLSSGGDGGGDSGTSSYVSQLMAMTNLTTEQTMSAQQQDMLANSLPGATVSVNNNGVTVTGVVQSTAVDPNGGLDLVINGQSYLSSNLLSINQTQAQAAVAAAAANSSGTSGAAATTPTPSN